LLKEAIGTKETFLTNERATYGALKIGMPVISNIIGMNKNLKSWHFEVIKSAENL